MKRRFLSQRIGPVAASIANHGLKRSFALLGGACALAALMGAGRASAQVLTVDTSGKGPVASTGPIDREYAQIEPTHVKLTNSVLDPKARLLIIRDLQSEQGFAMRPFPRGHVGLTLAANGKLKPVGESYVSMVATEGLSAKPGSRVIITDVKIERAKMVFELNGGPDLKHRFLRHVQIGVGPEIDEPAIDPELADQNGEPAGARLTLTFADHIPELTPAQVKALLAPLISFDVKTPIQAFTDTLPPALKEAILNHEVWVGMSTEMVLFAKGQPRIKSHEMDGQMPIDIWIYGTPPEDVTFVRINGNRVIQVEIGRVGKPLEIFTKDVVTPMLIASGSPELAAESNTRTVREGDAEHDTNKEAPAPPPTLRTPGEKLPTDNTSTGVMRPVQFPKPHPDEQPGANPDEQSSTLPASNQAPQAKSGQPGPQPATAPSSPANSQSPPANGQQQQPAPAKAQTPSAANSGAPAATSNASQPTPPANASQPN